MPEKIFICYRRDEESRGIALGIHQYLERMFGEGNVFIDVDMQAGAKFPEVLERRLADCRVLLALIGKRWLDARDDAGNRRLDDPNDWVRLEIGRALKRGVTVVPVRIEGADLPKKSALPRDIEGLVDHQAITVTSTGFRNDMAGLARDIRAPPKLFGIVTARLGHWPVQTVAIPAALAVLLGSYVLYQHFQPKYWTSWMNSADYQQEFNSQVKNQEYPSQIEAGAIGGAVKYRGHFEPFPSADFQFYSNHSLNDEEFSTADAEYVKKGFKRVFQQRIVIDARPYNQGTWIKP